MSNKIKAIEDFIRETTISNYIEKRGDTLYDVARYIYTAHIKPLEEELDKMCHSETALEDALAKAEADKAELVEALEHIVEYWNGSYNENAMHNACLVNEESARAALARVKGANNG